MLPVMPVISGTTHFQPIWVEDVARAFAKSIDNRHVIGHIYELGGPKVYSFQALLELLMTELRRKRIFIPVPGFVAKLMAIFTSVLPTPPITLDQLKLLGHDNVVKGDVFPAEFGEAAALELVLPTYICASRPEQLQHQMDEFRQHYRKGSI